MLWTGVMIVLLFTAAAAAYLWHDRRSDGDAQSSHPTVPATAPVLAR
jgi:hypothetical protein